MLFLDMRRARLGGQAVPLILPTIHDFRQHDMAPRSRRAVRTRVLREARVPPVNRGRREGRVPAAPMAPVHKKARGRNHRCRRSHPAFPAQWFYGLYALSPGTGLVCPRHTQALNEPLAHLAPASGRQDHTISPSATRISQEATRRFRYPSADTPYECAFSAPVLRTDRVHRIPLPTFVTIAKRPSLSRRDSDKGSRFPFFVKRNFEPSREIARSRLNRFTKLDSCACDFWASKGGRGARRPHQTRSTGESASKWRSIPGRAHARQRLP